MTVKKGLRVREGKAKILYETDPPSDLLIQYFKDDATAFNAQKRGQIKQKGQINNDVSSWIFPYLEKNGVQNHWVRRLSEREMLSRKVEIIPVETVVRNRAAGSICKRLGIRKGDTFEKPLVEYFLKSDELGDPLIAESHIFHFEWATADELQIINVMALKVNDLLRTVFGEVGLELIDFKLEFGREPGTSRVLLADEFTPDGCRLWDRASGEPMDKDRFREDLGGVEEAYLEVHRRLRGFFEGNS